MNDTQRRCAYPIGKKIKVNTPHDGQRDATIIGYPEAGYNVFMYHVEFNDLLGNDAYADVHISYIEVEK